MTRVREISQEQEIVVNPICPRDVPITQVMSKPVVTVTPDLRLDELVALFLQEGISGAPVVDPDGRPIGLVSKTDLLRWDQSAPRIVDDVMAPVALALPDNATVSQAAALMAAERIHRVVVVSRDERVVGVVSALDVVRWMAYADGFVNPGRSMKERGPV